MAITTPLLPIPSSIDPENYSPTLLPQLLIKPYPFQSTHISPILHTRRDRILLRSLPDPRWIARSHREVGSGLGGE